ncbi:MAG: ribosome silencing factor [Burkholderiaceae bacterium]|jgi:ribosome-associated protein|nr:ribosome silencing factor [Burkholderiaceae bacterium]
MSSEAAAKKNLQRLQRAIVDGLEDVKAHDIVLFDTAHLSALFECVVVASGTSNRQTKALAGSVRDAVRQAGFPKPRTEGEENGEWIIVDCGVAVVHIMQPVIRQYYRLEEIWGEKPVKRKTGAAKTVAAQKALAQSGRKTAGPAAPEAVKKAAVKKAAAKKTVQTAVEKTARAPARTPAQAEQQAPAKTAAKAAKKVAAKKTRSSPASAALKKSGKPASDKAAATPRKTTARKSTSTSPTPPSRAR